MTNALKEVKRQMSHEAICIRDATDVNNLISILVIVRAN